jgi:hypothetical protein
MAETKVTEVKAESEVATKKVATKLKAKNISNRKLYLEKGIVSPGETIEVTPAELACFDGQFLEKV